MSVSGICFLVFVCGSFAALSLGLALASIRYYQWREPTGEPIPQRASRTG